MGANRADSAVAFVEMRLENLDGLFCERGTANATHELFGLAAEHHAADNFDPAAFSCVIHDPEFATVSGTEATERGIETE